MIFKSVPTDHSLIIEGVFLNAYKSADCDAEVGCNQLSFDGVAMLDVGYLLARSIFIGVT
jgi:hypothetical protein